MTTRNRFEAFLLTGPGRLCRFILPLVVLVLSLGLTYMLWEDAQKNALKELKASFVFRQLEAAEKVNQRMLDYDQMLRGLRGLFRASESVNREEFREYFKALNIFERYKGIQALGFVEHVPVGEKNRHIAQIQQEASPIIRYGRIRHDRIMRPSSILSPSIRSIVVLLVLIFRQRQLAAPHWKQHATAIVQSLPARSAWCSAISTINQPH